MQRRFELNLMILSLVLTILPIVPASQARAEDDVIHQLRIYQLFDNTREVFHDRFRDDAERIMERYDFHIVAMWESRTEDGPEFVYLLEWPDPDRLLAEPLPAAAELIPWKEVYAMAVHGV